MGHNKKKILWISVFLVLFSGGIVAGFFYFSRNIGQRPTGETTPQADVQAQDFASVRVYYPSDGRLVMEERRVKRQTTAVAVAEAVMEEYLKGPSRGRSDIPAGVRVSGVYSGNDGILYVDLSEEFRKNFQGDALAEYFLLKGLYESVISNVAGIDDVKVIIEGKEIESIGGHLFALYPLKNTLSEVK